MCKNKKIINSYNEQKEVLKLDESKDDFNSVSDFDRRWEEKFGDTEQVIIMSAEDTLKQLHEMEDFV